MKVGRHPDSHYRQVARLYEVSGSRPGCAVAEQWSVPITTAHRWIKEARRRGLLATSPGPGQVSNSLPCNGCCPHCCP